MKCAHCGKEFEPNHGHQKYCSVECRQRAQSPKHKEYWRRYYQEHREELKLKNKIYRITSKWPKGKLQ